MNYKPAFPYSLMVRKRLFSTIRKLDFIATLVGINTTMLSGKTTFYVQWHKRHLVHCLYTYNPFLFCYSSDIATFVTGHTPKRPTFLFLLPNSA